MKRYFAGFALLLASGLQAQFPIVGTDPSWLFGLSSLTFAGPKFIQQYHDDVDTIHIYNLDLSVYRNLVVPPLPGVGWSQSDAYYVTEALFDTDPSTIEYLAVVSDPNAHRHIRVCREDGTILLYVAGDIQGGQSYQGVERYQGPIINGDNGGSYLILRHAQSTESTVYQLPGHLPCIACSAIAMGESGDEGAPAGGDLLAFPNPSAGEVTVQYTLPAGSTWAELIFTDARGALVQSRRVSGSGTLHMSTAELPAGTYLYHLATEQGRIGPQRMVVVR